MRREGFSGRQAAVVAVILTVWLALIGCEGDPGQPGRDMLGEDVYPPTVEMILPLAGTTIDDRIWLEARVANAEHVDSVGFLLDGRLTTSPGLTITQPPYQTWWDTDGLTPGTHSFQALVWDRAGRTGFSERVVFNLLANPDTLKSDTIGYFDKLSEGAYSWALPARDHPYDGFGARITMNRAGILRKVWVRFLRSVNWVGGDLHFEIRASDHGVPGDLLWEATLNGRTGIRIELPETTGWAQVPLRGIPRVPPEFFVLGELSPTNEGDTLAIFTDDGKWRNGHGLVRQNGVWQTFSRGPLVNLNPMIQVLVDSLGCYTPEEGW